MRSHSIPLNYPKQSGVVMFVALILLLILSLLGVTAARMQTVEERMARNDHNRQIGQQAAEAALRAGESGIFTGTYSAFGTANGLLTPDFSQGSPVTAPGFDWTIAANYTPYAGPALANLPTGAQAPKIVIEQLPPAAIAGTSIAAASLTGSTTVAVFRITAQGVGADNTSTTTLQSIVR
jgi:type IV pilus assembly protein PilX